MFTLCRISNSFVNTLSLYTLKEKAVSMQGSHHLVLSYCQTDRKFCKLSLYIEKYEFIFY